MGTFVQLNICAISIFSFNEPSVTLLHLVYFITINVAYNI